MDSDFLHILTVSLLHSCTFTFWFVWALRVSTMKDYPFLDVIQSKEKRKKKKQELISYLSKMLHFLSSLRTHSQHYQSFDYPEKKWIQNSSSSSLERPDLHIENAIEGCLICICLSFGNN